MRNLLAILLLLSSLAHGYPAGPANSVVRVPPAGGPVTTGAVDLTKSAAVTGLSANAIPFWNGVGAVGLGNSNCTWNAGTTTLTCGNTIVFSGLGLGHVRSSSGGTLSSVNQWVLATRPTVFSACTASPCAYVESTAAIPGVSTIVRTGLGVYRMDFVGGFWSVAPSCTVTSGGQSTTGFPSICNPNGLVTTTQFGFVCGRASNGAAGDDSFYIHCVGPR